MLDGHRNILTCDRNGNNVHRLTNGPTDTVIPRWSADGHSIYFALCHGAASDIWKKDLLTDRTKQMTTEGGSVAEESPDGRTLYFTLRDDISTPVFAMPSSGGPARKVLDDIAQRAMSVTREGIYYVSTSAQNELRFHDFKSEYDKTVLSDSDRKFYFVSVSQNHKLALLGVHGPPPGDLMLIRGLRF
jgi:Tol biopolymer transport system component